MKPMAVNEICLLPRCNAYPDGRIWDFAGSQELWSAADVLRHPKLTSEEKLWILVRGSFYDSFERRTFACGLAQPILPIFEDIVKDNPYPREALSEALDAVNALAKVKNAVDPGGAVSERLQLRAAYAAAIATIFPMKCGTDKELFRARAAGEAAASAADPNAYRCLIHTSGCSFKAVADQSRELERQLAVFES